MSAPTLREALERLIVHLEDAGRWRERAGSQPDDVGEAEHEMDSALVRALELLPAARAALDAEVAECGEVSTGDAP